MVLLEELFNGFFEKKYPLQLALDMFDTVSSATHAGMTRSIAAKLKKNITSLLPGYPSPDFRLRNSDGREYSSESFRGKYCYIGFCSLNNRECQREFEYLKLQNSRHSKYLQIVTVVPEKEKDLIGEFKDFNSVTWPVLYSVNEKSTFRDFKVKTYPVFYLFDKTGKFLLSPSPLPSENFEQVLFRIIRSRGEI